MKNFGKILLFIFGAFLYLLFTVILCIWFYLVPGRCETCLKRWQWFRRVKMDDQFRVFVLCKTCSNNSEMLEEARD